jgi:hypothetical protein
MRFLAHMLFIVFTNSGTLPISDSTNVKLGILNDTLISYVNNPRIELDFRIENNSDTSQIFYRLNSRIIPSKVGQMDAFCNPEKTGAGIILFVFDENEKPKTVIHWYVNDLQNPMTKERFDSIMNQSNLNSLKATVTLRRFDSETLHQQVDMREFNLEKGLYHIQLLYFSGRYISDFVSEEQCMLDKKNHKAEIFQGCVKSNKSVVIIK